MILLKDLYSNSHWGLFSIPVFNADFIDSTYGSKYATAHTIPTPTWCFMWFKTVAIAGWSVEGERSILFSPFELDKSAVSRERARDGRPSDDQGLQESMMGTGTLWNRARTRTLYRYVDQKKGNQKTGVLLVWSSHKSVIFFKYTLHKRSQFIYY